MSKGQKRRKEEDERFKTKESEQTGTSRRKGT